MDYHPPYLAWLDAGVITLSNVSLWGLSPLGHSHLQYVITLPSMAVAGSGEASPKIWSCYANFSVFMDYKRSISKEMNNDNDLNLHSMTKLSGLLRY